MVFAHGKNFHDGGWFDTSAGKPQVQVKREKNGAWETVGTLERLPRHDRHRRAKAHAGPKVHASLARSGERDCGAGRWRPGLWRQSETGVCFVRRVTGDGQIANGQGDPTHMAYYADLDAD